jgi:hypothetical protein
MRPTRSFAGTALVAVAAVLGSAVWGAPVADAGQTASTAAGCRADQVTVVVDFGSLGGGTVVRCTSNPSSGLDALSKAEFAYGFRPGFAGMVCTINSSPNPCNGAPADAYWAYWHAPVGGSWAYATQGAGSRTPPPGSVEGWAFGAERRPSVAPPAPASTTTTTPPTTRAPAPPATTAQPASPASPDAAPTGVAGASTTVPPTQVTADSTPATTATSTTPATSRTGDPEPTDDPPTAERAIEPASSGGRAGFGGLLGVALVGAVGLAGVWEFRRRRTG